MKNYNNCFTIDLEDSMPGIYGPVSEDAIIGQMGGGVGFNASKLRPKGALISKGGESSGVMSFIEVFDTSAKAIHTGGGRRGAHICILNVDHPDIE
jgi:ribonucleoside-diphosphate reductase alpha chain